MHKRLLLQFLGLTCAVGAFAAYSSGDYVFTTDARYKITSSDNLLTNGNFSVSDPSASGFSWTDATGAAVSTDYWTILPGEGPDGLTAVQSNSAAEGVTLVNTCSFTAGSTYVVSFKMKAGTDGAFNTTVVEGESAYVDVYANADGSINTSADRFQRVASSVLIGTDWTEVAFCFEDTVTNGTDGSLIISLGRLAQGTLIADFAVQEAREVYDTRISDRTIAYAEYLLNSGEFSKDEGGFAGIVTSFKDMFTDPSFADEPANVESMLVSFEEAQTAYLDENSASYLSYLSYGQITSSWSKYNNGDNWTSYGNWVFTGGASRWGHASSATEINYTYPGSYDLPWGAATIVASGVPAGRYMFAADAYALKYLQKKIDDSYYNADYSVYADYVKAFVGTDSVRYDTIDNRVYNTYTAFGNVAEGDTLRCGLYFPGFATGAGGGTFRISNVVLRIIGVSEADLVRRDYVASIYTQQTELKKRLDGATEEINGTTYPWGKDALQDSVTKYTELYNASLTYVDAEGNDLGVDIPDDYDDTLLAGVRAMNSARNTLYDLNEPYTTLVDYIPTAQERLDGDAWANADATYRTNLETAVANANTLVAAITSTPDSASYASSYAALAKAVYQFEHSCVTPGNPASEDVINPYFKNNNGQKSGVAEGWNLNLQSDSRGWLYFHSDEKFEESYCTYVSRGNSAYSQNKAQQAITVSMPGFYEFRCQAYAVNTNKSTYNGMWNGLSGEDSLRISGVNVFFGPETTPDSLNVCTYQETFGNSIWTYDELRTYSIGYEKTTDADEVLEFGLDALNNGKPMGYGCNLYGFGGVHVYYWADKQNYTDGIGNVPVDVLKNKQDTSVYNLMGVRVANSKADLQKGIYISNGKKFVVK